MRASTCWHRQSDGTIPTQPPHSPTSQHTHTPALNTIINPVFLSLCPSFSLPHLARSHVTTPYTAFHFNLLLFSPFPFLGPILSPHPTLTVPFYLCILQQYNDLSLWFLKITAINPSNIKHILTDPHTYLHLKSHFILWGFMGMFSAEMCILGPSLLITSKQCLTVCVLMLNSSPWQKAVLLVCLLRTFSSLCSNIDTKVKSNCRSLSEQQFEHWHITSGCPLDQTKLLHKNGPNSTLTGTGKP